MKRLQDATGERPKLDADAATILRALPREKSTLARRRRLLAELEARTVRRHTSSRLWPAFAAVICLVSIAFAAATLGNRWFRKGPPAAVTAPAALSPPVHTEATPRAPTQALASPEEIEGVFAAAKALRIEHDPLQAQRLLDTYLSRYPNGTLLEEALTLAIEAAAARHDPRAAELGKRYLARYPNGRFAATAQKAQEEF